MKIKEIDPVVYGWCRDHGLSVLNPEAEEEFDIWCAEIDAYREIDVNDRGEYEIVYGYDLAEERWLHDVELEDEILRGEFYDSYAEFLAEEYPVWQDDLYEECMALGEYISSLVTAAEIYLHEPEPNEPY